VIDEHVVLAGAPIGDLDRVMDRVPVARTKLRGEQNALVIRQRSRKQLVSLTGEGVEDGAVIGVAGVTRADAQGNLTRTLLNIHMEGDRFSGSVDPENPVIDTITLSDLF
jgi:hypothetical protein